MSTKELENIIDKCMHDIVMNSIDQDPKEFGNDIRDRTIEKINKHYIKRTEVGGLNEKYLDGFIEYDSEFDGAVDRNIELSLLAERKESAEQYKLKVKDSNE